MGVGYKIKDFFTDSEMERKREQYKSLVKKINKKLSTVEKKIELFKDNFDNELNNLILYHDDDSGMLLSTYMDKLAIFSTDTKKLLDYYEEIYADIKQKLKIAQERLEYYQKQCQLEDQQQKEITE